MPPASLRLLVAGPGFGKTCTARLFAEQLGRHAVWLHDPLARLPGPHGVPRESSPGAIAPVLRSYLESRYPEGATVVFDDAERFLGAPETKGTSSKSGSRTPPSPWSPSSRAKRGDELDAEPAPETRSLYQSLIG